MASSSQAMKASSGVEGKSLRSMALVDGDWRTGRVRSVALRFGMAVISRLNGNIFV